MAESTPPKPRGEKPDSTPPPAKKQSLSESLDVEAIESLTDAQAETYAVLLSMEFSSKAALRAAQVHGANLEMAAAFCIDYKPPTESKKPPDKKPEENVKNYYEDELKLSEDEVKKGNLVHKAVFFNDSSSIRAYTKLDNADIFNSLDHRGNTPLSLACRLGNWQAVHTLLDTAGADPRVVLPSGWTAIHDAIVAKNEQAVTNLTIHRIQRRTAEYEASRKKLLERLKKIPDFSIELHWAVKSWIPFMSALVSKFTNENPEDQEPFRIYKHGSNIRFDSKIRGITGSGISKGFLTFLYTEKDMLLIDHDRRQIEDALRKFRSPGYEELKAKTKSLLQTEEGISQLCPLKIAIKAQKNVFGSAKLSTVAGYECSQHAMSGLSMQTITKGATETRNFEEYFGEKKDEKEPEHEVETKPVKIDLCLSQKFPLKREHLITVLEGIAPASEDISRLLEILKLRFPDGFPVQLSFPVMPAISVQITFQNFKKLDETKDLFDIPRGYVRKR